MITSTGLNAATTAEKAVDNSVKDKTVLGKDDFMKLLLVELQHQDPTEPMDSEKILTQTSQLASLESADKTNTSLEALASSLGNSQQFSTISSIGKIADLGSNAISHDEGTTSTFELYFSNDVKDGAIEISDGDGHVVKTLDLSESKSGVYQFTWDGTDGLGNAVDSGVFHVNAKYRDSGGLDLSTKLGAYPIESVRFEDGKALLKVASSYVPLDNIKEVY